MNHQKALADIIFLDTESHALYWSQIDPDEIRPILVEEKTDKSVKCQSENIKQKKKKYPTTAASAYTTASIIPFPSTIPPQKRMKE